MNIALKRYTRKIVFKITPKIIPTIRKAIKCFTNGQNKAERKRDARLPANTPILIKTDSGVNYAESEDTEKASMRVIPNNKAKFIGTRCLISSESKGTVKVIKNKHEKI